MSRSAISSGPLQEWPCELRRRLAAGRASVLVTVAQTRGSTPRAAGTKMLVDVDAAIGTIGGGHLELKAIELARELLQRADPPKATLRRFPLGASLGQCCGGVAVLLFECFVGAVPAWLAAVRGVEPAWLITRVDDEACGKLLLDKQGCVGSLGDERLDRRARQLNLRPNAMRQGLETVSWQNAAGQRCELLIETLNAVDFHLQLFGAGHVGRALVQVVSGLNCRVHWVDSREAAFPGAVAPNVFCEHSDEPEWSVDDAPPNSLLLVLTHSHAEDYRIVRRALRRQREQGDLAFIGLIGSRTKRRKFEMRLRAEGFEEGDLSALTCPIGIEGISGKQPAEIAVAVAAQLLRLKAAVSAAEI